MHCLSKVQMPTKICEDCDGSGICPECKGEGFVLKKLSDESAERARLSAKNMATRYTAGYIFRYLLPTLFLSLYIHTVVQTYWGVSSGICSP